MRPSDLIQKWSLYREELERSQEVLLVEVNRPARQQLGELFSQCGYHVTHAISADKSLEMVEGGSFQLAVVSSVLIETDGLELVRLLRQESPHLDAVLTARDLSLELIQQAFDARVRDIIRKPIDSPGSILQQVQQVRRRSVDGQMQRYLMGELRRLAGDLDEASRLEATTQLERRLAAYKAWLGSCDRVLVMETDAELRRLSNALFESRLSLESAVELESGFARLRQGDINLLVLRQDIDPDGIKTFMQQLRATSPHLDVVFISPPQLQGALSALGAGVSLYLPRVPESPRELLPRLSRILSRHREKRLLNNLVLELFQEVLRVQGIAVDSSTLDQFYRLMGQVPTSIGGAEESLGDADMQDSVAFLDEILADVLGGSEPEDSGGSASSGRDRRQFLRLPEQRVIRFRPTQAHTKTLAYTSNFSEGGLFIRSTSIPTPGTLTELDLTLERGGEPLDLSCKGRVVWVATDAEHSPLGPGFGVKFVMPPRDLAPLLHRLILRRTDEAE